MSDEKNYSVLSTENGVPVKAWINGVPLEDQARKQLLNASQLPFIFKWIAAMPDVHWASEPPWEALSPPREQSFRLPSVWISAAA